ncbi:MAG: omptin family outer membrane protease [Treponema sp.]|jgi:outer membrane protease|nr:omptin family outer membrane protease [Treponema sp.]
MKNITVLPVLVIIVCAITANNSLYCQEKESAYSFSLDHCFGFVHGQVLELVYPENTAGRLLSELRWDMKPVFYFGMTTGLGRRDLMGGPGFFSDLAFKYGIPGDSGIMEDRDWMSVENGNLTHFSSHTNKTREFLWMDASAGASFPVKTFFYVKPFIIGSWMRFSFTGRNGSGKYARKKDPFSETYYSIDDNPLLNSYEGMEVIRYTQDWLLIAAGIKAGTKALLPFSFDLSFKISPFTYCAAVDNHLTTNYTFMDYTGWGLYLEPESGLSLTAGRFEFSMNFLYRYIGQTRGLTYMKYGGSSYSIAGGEAGAGLSLLDARFLIRMKF